MEIIFNAGYHGKKFAIKIRWCMSTFLNFLDSLGNLSKFYYGVLRRIITSLYNMLGIALSGQLIQ
tara:strand:- start:354 stop:548 length:195 start_codon:yes stop_codon:yes gene_type:complete